MSHLLAHISLEECSVLPHILVWDRAGHGDGTFSRSAGHCDRAQFALH